MHQTERDRNITEIEGKAKIFPANQDWGCWISEFSHANIFNWTRIPKLDNAAVGALFVTQLSLASWPEHINAALYNK